MVQRTKLGMGTNVRALREKLQPILCFICKFRPGRLRKKPLIFEEMILTMYPYTTLSFGKLDLVQWRWMSQLLV